MPASPHVDSTVDRLRRAAAECEAALTAAYNADRLLYRLDTAAAALDTSYETVRGWIKAGVLRPTRIGRAVYIAREDLHAFVEEHRGED